MSQQPSGDGPAFNGGITTTSPVWRGKGPKPLLHMAATQDICVWYILTSHPVRTNHPGAADRKRTLPWRWVLPKQPAAPDGASWEKLTLLFLLCLAHSLALPWLCFSMETLAYRALTVTFTVPQTALVMSWCMCALSHLYTM